MTGEGAFWPSPGYLMQKEPRLVRVKMLKKNLCTKNSGELCFSKQGLEETKYETHLVLYLAPLRYNLCQFDWKELTFISPIKNNFLQKKTKFFSLVEVFRLKHH